MRQNLTKNVFLSLHQIAGRRFYSQKKNRFSLILSGKKYKNKQKTYPFFVLKTLMVSVTKSNLIPFYVIQDDRIVFLELERKLEEISQEPQINPNLENQVSQKLIMSIPNPNPQKTQVQKENRGQIQQREETEIQKEREKTQTQIEAEIRQRETEMEETQTQTETERKQTETEMEETEQTQTEIQRGKIETEKEERQTEKLRKEEVTETRRTKAKKLKQKKVLKKKAPTGSPSLTSHPVKTEERIQVLIKQVPSSRQRLKLEEDRLLLQKIRALVAQLEEDPRQVQGKKPAVRKNYEGYKLVLFEVSQDYGRFISIFKYDEAHLYGSQE